MDKSAGVPEHFKQAFGSSISKPWRSSQADDPRPTEELISRALAATDEDEYWELVMALQWRDSPELTAADERLARSADPRERGLAADILGQNGLREKTNTGQAVDILLAMLEREQDPTVLNSIAVALGHRNDPRAIGPLLPLRHHPYADVRFGVVHGLSWHEDERAIVALIELSRDGDTDVRDWATFGIGAMIQADTPAIRDALWARVADEDEDTRGEALAGLALRGDRRVVTPLLAELEAIAYEVGWRLYEAAIEAGNRLADPRLYHALLRMQGAPHPGFMEDDFAAAIDRCAKAAMKPEL